MRKCLILAALLISASEPGLAYIGPGAGISFVGALGTWLLGILIALFAILFWPIRLLIRRMRGKSRDADRGGEAGTSTEHGQ